LLRKNFISRQKQSELGDSGFCDGLLHRNVEIEIMGSFGRNFQTKDDLKQGLKFKLPAIL